MTISTIILAAGQGTRMHSKKPKVLHPLLGKPLVLYSLEAVKQLTDQKPIVIVGYGSEEVQKAIGDRAQFVLQQPQLGTGHAVMQAEPLLGDIADQVLVLPADMPLLSAGVLKDLVDEASRNPSPVTMLTMIGSQSRGFGRVIRNPQNKVIAIVEEADATSQQLAIKEYNVGVYCFRSEWLWQALPRVPISKKGEYYLTNVIEIAVKDGFEARPLVLEDESEAIGINHRAHLAEAAAVLRKRINERWMLHGVTLIDPQTTYIEPDVTIGKDTIIWPGAYLQGSTTIGEDCEIGPNTIIRDTHVGNDCKIVLSVLDHALVEDQVDIGPFGHLRKGAHLSEGVHIGNFGEIKNSTLGRGTKMGHFSYVGDATIGSEVNIGAGTITCNFDGERKNPTEIGDHVFLGSDTMLVAPVKLGKGSRTGAGSVVTKDIQPYTLAVGAPARAIRKLEKRD